MSMLISLVHCVWGRQKPSAVFFYTARSQQQCEVRLVDWRFVEGTLFSTWLAAGAVSWREEVRVEVSMLSWALWQVRNNVVWNKKVPKVVEIISSASLTFNQ
uniref:Uncharacterized protein n=1 Tax=Cannabis sativa TaxID=3483 RepID=A0A803Q2P5_CANSA